MKCNHDRSCISCEKCDSVVFKLSSYNATNLVQILQLYIRDKEGQGSGLEKMTRNILKELIDNSYRLQPTYSEYKPKTTDAGGSEE